METVAPESVGLNSQQLARISQHLQSRYLQPGKIPGYQVLVARDNQVCFHEAAGLRDIERATPLTADTVVRIYSMTKPVTSVALMTLFEQGLFALDDPVYRYIPEWRDLRVWRAGSYPLFDSRPCDRPMTVRDLLMHTSGLTYDFLRADNVDHAYRELQVGNPLPGTTLKDMITQLAGLPLAYSPGDCWNYSIGTDVLGYLVEVISGQSFPEFLQQTLFDPLGMVDTGFNIREDQLPRFASCYQRNFAKELELQDDGQDSRYRDRTFFSGGGGLVSTMADYLRFCRMLGNGGSLDGQRILGSRTLEFMTANHIPGGADLSAYAVGSFSETAYQGVGFGLGFASKLDPVANGTPASEGTFYWGGLASTLFWVDPVEDLIVIFMTQLIPSSTFNFRGQLESLVYAALE
jgi:CubicO group peptidase (beta-lactamase class C family)